jgi:crossover junction endodeoxyribonuclease RusA
MILPWPDLSLSANGRRDLRALTARRRLARQTGYLAACAEAEHFHSVPLALTIIFYPPDRRRRDLDGLLSAMKPTIDGIFEWLELDDHLIARVTLERGAVMPAGQVELELSEL